MRAQPSPCGRAEIGDADFGEGLGTVRAMPHQQVPMRNRRLGKRMRGALTDAEFRLWRVLSRRQLEGLKFRRQAPIGPYIVDFFCAERRLAVEVDGGQHSRYAKLQADARRDAWLTEHGVRVVRFQNDEVLSNLDGVCSAILTAAVEDGMYPSPKPALPVSALPQGEG